ncbi:MAG: glycosyltransferase family 2 protein [Patescibacteria group bacterium]|nr:glycosyltransferase family 2 protein [Patescibacteria group bacterium]
MNLSIIIVNYKVKDLLDKALESLFEFNKNINLDVIVVDNDSNDGSEDMVKTKYPQVRYVESGGNLGFAKANNIGYKLSKYDHILLLNPDTEFIEHDSLKKLIELFNKRENIGAMACKLLNSDDSLQPSCRTLPTLSSQIFVLLKIHNFFPYLIPTIKKYYMLDFDYNSEKKIEQVMGAFLLTHKSVIQNLDNILLDEDYWLLFEEVDLCTRIKKYGYNIIFTPITSIKHHKGESFKQEKILRNQKTFNKSLLTYFKKHNSKLSVLILQFFMLVNWFIVRLVVVAAKLKILPKKKKYL